MLTWAEGMSRAGSQSRSAAAVQKSRLQEKLERATQGRSPSASRPSVEIQRTASPVIADTTRSSIDSRTSEIIKALNQVNSDNIPTSSEPDTKDEEKTEEIVEEKSKIEEVASINEDTPKAADIQPSATITTINDPEDLPQISQDSASVAPIAVEEANPNVPAINLPAEDAQVASQPRPKSPTTLDSELTMLQRAHTQTLEEHQAEITSHLERIDALQSKLNYLSDQLSATSKASAEAAPASSPEKKLAEKDNQIAGLLKEGEKLSKKELQQSGLIKKLRVKIGEQDIEIADLKRRVTKAEEITVEERERTRRAEAAEKLSQEKLKIVARIEKDVEEIKREKESASITITELRKQLADSVTRAEQAEKKAQSGALEAERRTVAKLNEELEDIKIEKKLAEDRAKTEVQDVKEEAARQSERSKVVEMELKSEISVSYPCQNVFVA
ncbi:hypothetical protein EJ05DRAFT_189050 [Pseudovirgaria hyperparasitica]|uniref:TATA element modulatory factor 1 TATA binding domain-containing protein n=1 Tax=Pseudovirgaria hyperparasitica TaxID=470096 RepID=A0A6A6WGE4_9PEZI|nr:uncharacterized protein EJ05DRAFT_189050 [Pseudovirgaria hyperparasitica]KAF2761922.1 hypothetical protein EJ05DRAFT_189050 [Pseudovirgaria hyperparasitica]